MEFNFQSKMWGFYNTFLNVSKKELNNVGNNLQYNIV